MPNVQMPDGTVVAMPDNPTPELIQQVEQVHQSGTLETMKDYGKAVQKAVQKGVVSGPGFLGDLVLQGMRHLTDPGVQGVAAGTPPLAAMQALTSLFGNPAKGTNFGDATHALETAGGAVPVPEPQSSGAKATANVLEPAISTLASGGSGGPLSKFLIGLFGGGGGELAARYFGDTPLTRFLGSVASSGGASVVASQVPNAQKLVKAATEHMGESDWDNASKLESVLNAADIPHAKSQLLGPKSTLDDVVAAASSNPSVRPKLVTIPTEAAPQAQQAVNVFTHQNLPPPGPGSRSEILTDIQGAAADKLKSIRDQSNSAFTAAKPPDTLVYPEDRTKALYQALVDLANSPKYGIGQQKSQILSVANELKTASTVDTSGVNPTILMRAQQAAKTSGQPLDLASLPGAKVVDSFETNANKVNNLAKGLRQRMVTDPNFNQLPVTDVVNTIKQFTPEFDAARAAKTAVMENQYNPASRSLLGQIAQQGGGPNDTKQTARDAAMSIVFNPTQPQGAQIRQLAKDMGGDQVADLLREHINRTMQQVLRSPNPSPNSFVTALYQSPAQKENIEAALEVAAKQQKMNPDAVKVGFRRLMEALDSFKDMKLSGGVSPAATATEASQNVVSKVAQPLSGIRRYFEQLTTKGTYNQIADLVTSPDGLQKLRAIAKEPDQALVRQMVLGIVGSTNPADAASK